MIIPHPHPLHSQPTVAVPTKWAERAPLGAPFWTECHYQSVLWASEVASLIGRDAPVEMIVGGLRGKTIPFVHSWAEIRLPQLVIYDSVAARYVSPEVYRREYGEPEYIARYSLDEYLQTVVWHGNTGPWFSQHALLYLQQRKFPPVMGDKVDQETLTCIDCDGSCTELVNEDGLCCQCMDYMPDDYCDECVAREDINAYD